MKNDRISNQNSRFLRAGLAAASLLALGFATESVAQPLTHADSGWVRIFNGNNFDGLYSRAYGATIPMVHPPASPWVILYAGTDTATIRVNVAANQGNLGTDDSTFSHYRTRWESKFDAVGTGNSGLVYHVSESAVRMQNNWPRGIEFQGKQDEGGSAYSIQQVTFTSHTAGSGSKLVPYAPTGTTLLNTCEIGCPTRSIKGTPVIPTYASATPTVTRWLRYELVARGADSAFHSINDTLVMKIFNIRISNDSTKTTGSTASGSASISNFTPTGPYDHGRLALQSEGALVGYRRWEVMRFPPSTPMNENFLHKLFLTGRAQATKPAGGSAVSVQWRSIGTIPKVKIQYQMGAGAWLTVTDSTANTGAYAWTAPATVSDSLRFRISSVDYVIPDSTLGSIPAAILPGASGKASAGELFAVIKGSEWILAGVGGFDRAEIRDASGQQVRSLPVIGASFRWNLTDGRGTRVRPGFYFVRLTGSGAARNTRVLVLQ